MVYTPGLNARIPTFHCLKGMQHSLCIKIIPPLQIIRYLFYNSVLSLRIIHPIKFHLIIRICAAQQFLHSTIRLLLPIHLRNLFANVILHKFIETPYTAQVSTILLQPHNFLRISIQLYINVF